MEDAPPNPWMKSDVSLFLFFFELDGVPSLHNTLFGPCVFRNDLYHFWLNPDIGILHKISYLNYWFSIFPCFFLREIALYFSSFLA
ncbi:hypothetical protein RJT34_13320 [Clitoria ternatea]|uniref:Uncharacterized protein n=1 Tax=Clitoria ternatea TaxID=43366 RepID=A0AAN9JNB1_CLITE